MHTQRNRILFFGVTALAGLAALALHRYMIENCFDGKGLLIPGNLPGVLQWVLGIGYLLVLTAMLTTIGGDGTYADNFPRCLLSGSLMLTAGGVLLASRSQLSLDTVPAPEAALLGGALMAQLTDRCMTVLPWAAGISMLVLGAFRMAGRKPIPLFSALICLFYMLMLVSSYRLWSADPNIHEYAYQLLALVLLMLCSFHRTCCDAGVIQRRKLLATGLTASVCCMASLSTGLMPGFYLASGLWAAGSMCNPAVLPPDPEEDEEEDARPDGDSPAEDEAQGEIDG